MAFGGPDARTLAQALLEARDRGAVLDTTQRAGPSLDLEAAYDAAAVVDGMLRGRGWRPVGRKIGFTNRATWREFDLATPIWSFIYDRTLVRAGDAPARIPTDGLAAARIEPEIVVGLRDGLASAPGSPAELVDAIAWVAPGLEIVDCHYPGWRFSAAEAVADFGAHAFLAVGPPVPADDASGDLAASLASATVELLRDGEIVEKGAGRNALDGPVDALGFLVEALAGREQAPPLAPGEIVTTGTLTGLPFVSAGERWVARFDGAGLGSVTVDLA